jgi:DNA-binding transcriptional ArsR family regulator
MKPMPSADLSTLFSALADPTRRAILARLSEGDAPVKDLAEPFDLSGPAITKHLKVLERAGLISRSREGQQRPCHLEARALEPAVDFLEQYRAMWEERLDRLGEYLKTVTQQPAGPPPAVAAAAPQAPPKRARKSPTKKARTASSRGTKHGKPH